jgi:transcriptional regulator with XRE-family HTH domain
VLNAKIPAAKNTFGRAFRTVRLAKGKTQDDFVHASGRTHVSMLERGVNAPTLTTIEGLASELKIHPLTLAALTYAAQPTAEAIAVLLERVRAEVTALGAVKFAPSKSRSRPTSNGNVDEEAKFRPSKRARPKA